MHTFQYQISIPTLSRALVLYIGIFIAYVVSRAGVYFYRCGTAQRLFPYRITLSHLFNPEIH